MPPRVPETQAISVVEQTTIDAINTQLAEKLKQHNVSEGTMLRFVRGFKDDAQPQQKAIDMLSAMLDWRTKEKVDEWGLSTTLPGEADFRKQWVSGIHGVSQDGHPIYIERLGSIDPHTLTTNFTIDQIMQFHIQLMERITAHKDELSVSQQQRVYKQLVILDLKDVGMAHFGKRFTEPMKSVIHIDQFYYPETLKLMFITNASWVFKTIWKLVSPWIDPITRDNIIFGSAELAKHVDLDQLPRFLGGTCKCAECLITEFIAGEGAKKAATPTPTTTTTTASAGHTDDIHTQQTLTTATA